MEGISKEYTLLFVGISDTIEKLEDIADALKKLQQIAEEIYITQGDEEIDLPIESDISGLGGS